MTQDNETSQKGGGVNIRGKHVEVGGDIVGRDKNVGYRTGSKDPQPTELDQTFTILFLTADPSDISRLRLGEEFREIRENLQLAKWRDRFRLEIRTAVRSADLSQALFDVQPRIVHFSGHGSAEGSLYLEDQSGYSHPVKPVALSALFAQFADEVDCVVLNACYSELQANAIAQHIDHVIGMDREISDVASIAFSVGFYQALGAGRSVEKAYNLGCVQIGLQGYNEERIPKLIKKA